MLRLITVLTIILVCSAAQVSKAAVESRPRAYILCKNHGDVRTIAINRVENSKACTTSYSKHGAEEVVEQNRSLTECQARLQGLREKLEASNFSCRSIEKAVITTSSEVVAK